MFSASAKRRTTGRSSRDTGTASRRPGRSSSSSRTDRKEVRQKLGKYVQEGRIEIPALFGNEIGALCSHEELIRLMYPSFRLKRELGAPIRTASITDVPGLSWGLPTVLAGAGVKYFFAGLPDYFGWGGRGVHGFWDEAAILRHGIPDAFRWEGPDGGSVLVYYQGGYGGFTGGIGPHSYEEILEHLPGKLAAIEKQGSPLSVVRYIHNGVDNFPPDVEISRVVRQWNDRWAYPKLIVATNAMFFEQLEKQCHDVRTFRGELPDTDYVVGAASTALETGINRVAHDRLHAAEKFATMASLLADYPRPPDKSFWITTHGRYPDLNRTLGEAYENALLYDEHTWGMAHPAGTLQDWSWSDKSRYAYRAAGLAESILGGSLGAIADRIALDKDGQHLVVFNALSVTRTDVVRVPSKGAGWGKFLDFAGETVRVGRPADGQQSAVPGRQARQPSGTPCRTQPSGMPGGSSMHRNSTNWCLWPKTFLPWAGRPIAWCPSKRRRLLPAAWRSPTTPWRTGSSRSPSTRRRGPWRASTTRNSRGSWSTATHRIN